MNRVLAKTELRRDEEGQPTLGSTVNIYDGGPGRTSSSSPSNDVDYDAIQYSQCRLEDPVRIATKDCESILHTSTCFLTDPPSTPTRAPRQGVTPLSLIGRGSPSLALVHPAHFLLPRLLLDLA